MAFLQYDGLIDLIDTMGKVLQDQRDCIVNDMFPPEHPVKVVTYTNPERFSMLLCSRPNRPDEVTRVQIAGGGGIGGDPAPVLYEHLLLRSASFDWGGPFAGLHPNGTVTYGSRTIVPSSMVCGENYREATQFLMGMINVIGQIGRLLGNELTPRVGGSLLNGAGPRHDSAMLAALMGPRQ